MIVFGWTYVIFLLLNLGIIWVADSVTEDYITFSPSWKTFTVPAFFGVVAYGISLLL